MCSIWELWTHVLHYSGGLTGIIYFPSPPKSKSVNCLFPWITLIMSNRNYSLYSLHDVWTLSLILNYTLKTLRVIMEYECSLVSSKCLTHDPFSNNLQKHVTSSQAVIPEPQIFSFNLCLLFPRGIFLSVFKTHNTQIRWFILLWFCS